MNSRSDDKYVFVSAPLRALAEGLFEQNTCLSELKSHGDFGIGTFNDLDGEMVMLDGMFYQISGDGVCTVITDDLQTPFACVTRFVPDFVETIDRTLDNKAFQDLLGIMLPSDNMFYAVRIDGSFSYVKTRSVPRQHNYRHLVDVAREQTTFEFHDVNGTLAGFYTPDFMDSLNVPGFHLHFLNTDRSGGGHLLLCNTSSMTVTLCHIPRLLLSLPSTLDFLTTDLTRNTRDDIDEAERDS